MRLRLRTPGRPHPLLWVSSGFLTGILLSAPADAGAQVTPGSDTLEANPGLPAQAGVHPALLDMYDLSSDAGIQLPLPRGLEEVSGLATSSDGRLFAHNDERAVVYEIDPGTGRASKVFSVGAMALPGDFEGLAIAGERFFLLTSLGQLIEFREGSSGSAVRFRAHNLNLMNVCELEGLAFDEVENVLLLPCKTPRARNLAGRLVVLAVSLDTMKPLATPRVILPLKALDDAGLGDDFSPSAIEVHPATRSLILAAGRQEALVEIGPGGKILATDELKRRVHPQPEGLAFLPDGALVLADEGRGGAGRLTRYYLRGGVPR